MEETRVAFIGAGGNASGHMKRVKEVDGATIVAICDVAEDRTQAAAAEMGASAWYADHHALLDKEDFDALYISVPPFAHTDAEILAAQKGAALFVEKPVVLDMEQGIEILEVIEKAGVVSCVGYQLRYLDAAQRVKQYLSDKTVAMVSHHRWGGLPGTAWWRVMEQSGGQLVEQTTHGVDMMRYVLGDIVEVYAKYATRTMADVENLTIPDSQEVLLEFDTGALGLVSTACMGGGKSDMSFLLRDGTLEFGYTNYKISPDPGGEYAEPLAETASIDDVFIEAVRAKDQSKILSSYRDGLKTCDVTLAANRSATLNRPVRPYFADNY